MRSIRKFAYATVLGLSIFAIQPTLAAAEDARGVFTLSHEVHWQKYVLRPGHYAFSVKETGSPTFLMVRGLNGTGTDAILLVPEVETAKPNGVDEITLVSRGGQSFVSSMELPGYDMSLHFAVPPQSASK
jgi:hypothetical protein